jgi:methylmalonyl-CoA/ethylmalonyl-CoA epimerase
LIDMADNSAANSFPGTFHHIGLACRNIDSEMPGLRQLGYTAEGDAVEDPLQQVRVQFFTGGGPRIELVVPTTADSPVSGLIKRGTRLYHLAYVVPDLDAAVAELERERFRCVSLPAPAVAFGMRRIVFLLSDTGMLIELIEGPSTHGSRS